MKTFYLGNRGDDVRVYQDDDVIHLTPSAGAIGSVHLKKDKDAYLASAWAGVEHSSKYFYYRAKKRVTASGSKDDVFDSPEKALDMARAWRETNNKNTKDSVISIKADDITEAIADKFFFMETKIDYPEQEVPLDARFLGMWLGDGTSTCTEITTIDEPIKKYIKTLSDTLECNVSISTKKVPGHCIVNRRGTNPIRNALRYLHVLNNKHIPEIYMMNSVKVRTDLLAGLLDTDGYLQNNVYEFVQKRKELAHQTMMLARSLGIYATVIERLARATNSNNPEYGTYHRVYIHMTPRSPELGLLLERKQWKASPEDRGDYTIKLALKQEQESFRHEWTDALLAKLKDAVPKYINKFGQIQWKDLQEAEPDFKDFSTGATRKTYEQQIKSATPETAFSAVVNVQAIKTRFIEVVCRFQSEKNTIQWDALLESDPIFKRTEHPTYADDYDEAY